MKTTKIIPNEVMLPEVARLIAQGHTVTIAVRGNSMNPFFLDHRDKVTLGSFRPDDLQPGVAVLARDLTGRIVFHRIIRRHGDVLTLQGDGNLEQTEQTRIDLVMGRMTEAIRKNKRYAVDGRIWRTYSYWWIRLKPVRRWLLAVFRRL